MTAGGGGWRVDDGVGTNRSGSDLAIEVVDHRIVVFFGGILWSKKMSNISRFKELREKERHVRSTGHFF